MLMCFFIRPQGSIFKRAVLKTMSCMAFPKCLNFSRADVAGITFASLWVLAAIGNMPWYSLHWHTLSPKYLQYYVPVHRHRDPLRMIVDSSHLPSILKVASAKDLAKNLLEFIQRNKRNLPGAFAHSNFQELVPGAALLVACPRPPPRGAPYNAPPLEASWRAWC